MATIILDRWKETEPGIWAYPGKLGCVNLSPPELNDAAGSWGLFSMPGAAPAGSIDLGTNLDGNVNAAKRASIKTGLALGENIVATTVRAILNELLVQHADPTGLTRWKPLMPETTPAGPVMRIWLGGFSLINEEVFNPASHPLVYEVLKEDYKKVTAPLRIRRKGELVTLTEQERAAWLEDKRAEILWTQVRKYAVALEQAADLWTPPGFAKLVPKPHGTLINESFGTAAAVDLGPDQTWTEVLQTWEVTVNAGDGEATPSTANRSRATCNGATGSTDMYAEVAVRVAGNTDLHGGGTRTGTGTNQEGYIAIYRGAGASFLRGHARFNSTGTGATLDSDTTSPTLPSDIKEESNGSSHTMKVDEVTLFGPTTNTDVTGSDLGGLVGHTTASSKIPRYEADLLGGGAALDIDRLEREVIRGVMRGVLRGGL